MRRVGRLERELDRRVRDGERELDRLGEAAPTGVQLTEEPQRERAQPPVGRLVRHLLEERGLQRALAAGDDTTDIDSFRALDGLEVAVRVAVAAPESPELLLEAADVIVDGPAAFVELLRRL